MADDPIVQVSQVTHRYGSRVALDRLSLDVGAGSLVSVLGPNGSGKTTLFKILTTLIVPTDGTARIAGHDVRTHADQVRRQIGVVFQRSSLDDRLTVFENLIHQGHLYGLSGRDLRERAGDALERFALADRKREIAGLLSGGLQQRVELAKALLHRPRVLLMDEPGTGLDPAARLSVMRYLEELRTQFGMTIMLTTHLLDEAERCDRVVILDQGKVVASDTPEALKRAIGGDVVSIKTRDAASLAAKVTKQFGVAAEITDGTVRMEWTDGHKFVGELVNAFPGDIDRIAVGPPTLEDVFIHFAGHEFHHSGSN